jgi:hypothetical protein
MDKRWFQSEYSKLRSGKMKKTILTSALLAMAGVGLMAGNAMATPISGDVSMTGTYQAVDIFGVPTTIALATGIDFGGWFAGAGASDNTMFVNTASLDFFSLIGTIGTINNFQFSPASTPVIPLWLSSAGAFSFDMNSLSVTQHDSDEIGITGTGILHGVGYDDTVGTWLFTAQGDTGLGTFSWSSTATPVPEPATMLLFGTGIASLAGVIRRRRNK